jgi:hypothetical protein
MLPLTPGGLARLAKDIAASVPALEYPLKSIAYALDANDSQSQGVKYPDRFTNNQ